MKHEINYVNRYPVVGFDKFREPDINTMVGKDEIFQSRPIRFYIPDLERLEAPVYLCNILDEYRDCFMPNVKIEAIYGVFNGMLWNGGRGPRDFHRHLSLSEIAEIITAINDLGISVRFTTTNMLLEHTHLDDEFCNAIFEIANKNTINDALVASPVLYNYIKTNYQNIRLCKSVVNHIDTISDLCSEINTYNWHTIVPACRLTLEQEFLDLDQKYKDHIEIMLNGCFGKKCNCIQHYIHESRVNLDGLPNTPMDCIDDTGHFIQRHYKSDTKVKRTEIYRQELVDYFIRSGYSRFKVVGRERSPAAIVAEFLKYTLRDLRMQHYFLNKFESED